MGVRRQARECALQMLFAMDLTGDRVPDIFRTYFSGKTIADDVREFACRLVSQTAGRSNEIDLLLQATADNWRLERMAAVDRNVLRLAVGEFLAEPQVPRSVVINEAIEIAKKFSGPEAAQFVNGILDAVGRRLPPAEESGGGGAA